jgi:hypothetical protein
LISGGSIGGSSINSGVCDRRQIAVLNNLDKTAGQ